MSKLKLVPGSLLLAIFLTACSSGSNQTTGNTANVAPEANAVTSTSVVKVSAPDVVVGKDEPGKAEVKLTIDPGYHVNANPPTYPYLKATALEVPPDQAVSADFFVYPNAITRKFAFAEQSLAVYEGETSIKVQLKANKSTNPGSYKVNALLRVQACDDKVCYAPGSIDFVIPVTVK